MEIIKVGLVMVVGLGSTWAARETSDSMFGPSRANLMQEPTETPEQTGPTQPAAESESSAPAVPEMSREEMEEDLRRAEAEIAGKPSAKELEEFRPSKPLAADLAIALPSDI